MSVMNDMNDAEYALKVRVATLEALIRDVAIPFASNVANTSSSSRLQREGAVVASKLSEVAE